jgi:ABC-type lipoprotein release transport system permease subunit
MGSVALQNFLSKVNALDPFIYTAVAALLTAVAAASCFVPTLRATRVNPMEALRTE